MNYIDINKSIVPYTFEMLLGDEVYKMRIDYNNTGAFFTLSLAKGDELICAGEPIIYGMPLFGDLKNRGGFPTVTITPIDESGSACMVTFDNLSRTVLLRVTIGGDSVG